MKKLSSDSRRTRLVGFGSSRLKWRSSDDRQVLGPPHVLVCSRHPLNSAVGPGCIVPSTKFRIRSEGKCKRGKQSPSPKEPSHQHRHRFVPSFLALTMWRCCRRNIPAAAANGKRCSWALLHPRSPATFVANHEERPTKESTSSYRVTSA